jgi:hypothetical protein
VGGQILGLEVIGRGSPDSPGLRSNGANPLIAGLVEGILISIHNHLGGFWESVSRSGYSVNPLFYRRILRVPNGIPRQAAQRQPRRRA